MRLLNAQTLKLIEFLPDQIPPYVILSHTWGADEILFSDIEDPTARLKTGWDKVKSTCAQAIKDGFEYAWIDTCCIDKTSSFELSEALNSMFLWYKNANLCYAYLSDVPGDCDPYQEGSEFERSRWFTRGWTLQELLASLEIVFYSHDWVKIGMKSTLAATLSRITNIDEEVIEDPSQLGSVSIPERMSWAAHRKTTRPEDVAYCLMGIFSVYMSLRYGEGGERAFARLQEKIIINSDNSSIFGLFDSDARFDTGQDFPAKSPAQFTLRSQTVAYHASPQDLTLGWANDYAHVSDSGYASMPNKAFKPGIATETHQDNIEAVGHVGEGNTDEYSFTDAYVTEEGPLDDEDATMDDADSVYSLGPYIQPSKKEAYILSLAEDLMNRAITERLDEETLDKLSAALPNLLRTFASMIGSSESMQIYRDVMVFIRRHRREISDMVRQKYLDEHKGRPSVLGDKMVKMDLSDLMSKWTQDIDTQGDPNALPEDPSDIAFHEDKDDDDEIFGQEEQDTDILPELSTYKEFVSGLPSYQWLLRNIRKEIYLSNIGETHTNIRRAILDCLPKAQCVSRKQAPPRHILILIADWNPNTFLEEQGYLESPEKAIERAITITGSRTDAQAATTIQYLSQTWPSTGIHLLRIVKHIVVNTAGERYSYNLPDGTKLIAWLQGSEVRLEVTGISECIAEIGEQLAWLGSALRSSPYETGVAVCNAFASEFGMEELDDSTSPSFSRFFFHISFNIEFVDEAEISSSGQCWHQLFGNPVIVSGYPVLRRPMSNLGIEISLDTMARLVQTQHINTFNRKFYIKGFCEMLVPTHSYDDIIVWHLLHKRNGERISYNETISGHADISLSALEKSRHILGWCPKVRYLAGAADATYSIDRSWLRGPQAECKLKDAQVSQGKLIQSDHKAAFGNKDKSPHVSRGTYKAKLFSISRKYVVLWDVQDKRGWLVNATSALLHLLRASIEYNKADELSSCFLFESTDFKEAEVPYTASAAIEVLMNTANLNMVLYDEGDLDENVQFRVRDRIEALYQTLEKIIDYQEMIAGRNGEGLILKSRKDLEGWDFKDIATNEDPIYPRLAKLKTMGKGWVDFTRAIQAVTLFGRGFRNIIEPVRNSGMCSHWRALPPNKYYLAASMADLSRIIDRFGNPRANPPRLTESIAWNPLIMTFKEMRECRADSPCQYELSQTMLPSQLSQRPLRRVPFPPRDIGAVVFGYNKDARWIWNDIGHPKKGDLPESDEESDDDDFPNDSGIGSSSGISSTIPKYEAHGDLRNGSICSALAHENYKIAIICALPKELMAVRALFDNLQCDLPQHENDTNSYALGRMGYHNVVAACLPYEEYGTNAASKVASDMEKSFPNVKWYFVVGIGGGVPSTNDDIRLGDVVVSTGVIQHDMGKTIQGGSGFNHTGIIQRPARSLMTAVSMIRSDPRLPHNPLAGYVADIVKLQSDYGNPGEEHDHLFQFDSKHEAGQATCKSCTGPRAVRKPRPPGPHIHYGLIASGNQVIKDAKTRDRLRDDMNILCFEMEGAGVMTTSNCLVIRGICDYADSHKNDGWHKYAAATAAAYTKFFLSRLQSFDMLSRGVVYVQKRAGSLFDDGENGDKRLRYDWE